MEMPHPIFIERGQGPYVYDADDNLQAIPLPAALPLYGTGLAVMGFLGWRRKRKEAAGVTDL